MIHALIIKQIKW